MDMLWCHGAQNIGISNRKLNYPVECTVYHDAHPSQRDRQTNIMTIARRFVLKNAARGENFKATLQCHLYERSDMNVFNCVA